MKVCLLNLGCKVNQYEIDAILNSLSQKYETTTELEKADIYIVNTCAVTSEAEKKSRQYISKIKSINENAKIIVCGCASQNNANQFLEKENVTLVLGTARKGEIVDLIEKETGNLVCDIPLTYEDNMFSTNVRTRAYLKIQDGCNNFCSYCLIPYVRGRSRSRNLDSIIKEAEVLSKTANEIVVTGINISDYKIDGKLALPKLMESLSKINSRIRIGSLEVNIITDELLTVLSSMKNFCPQFHLSLQSGSNAVLKKMNRHYTREEYLEKIELIRKYFVNPAITTDIIVGFPTETEEDFCDTIDLIEKVRFSQVHYFAYSSRTGTVASKLPQINGNIIKEREKKLKLVADKIRNDYLNLFIGKTLQVLIEEKAESGLYTGFSDNYLRCYVEGNDDLVGKILILKVKSIYLDGFMCKI